MQKEEQFGLLDRAPGFSKLIKKLIPQLNAERRSILYGHLDEGAVCNSDFLITMILSTAIAGFGLLLNSAATIIGAMLVAPLMTPLIAAGCGLVRGDLKLFHSSTKAMLLGAIAGFGVSIIIGLLTPKDALTMELVMRGNPNILDLFVAFLAGAAAAYATARPRVVASLAGVAVAAALVPPLATVGIALTELQLLVARGAAILFITNLVAIVLGSALMYRLMGVRGTYVNAVSPLWVRRSLLGLILFSVLLIAPLGYRLADQLREGQLRPHSFPLSPRVARVIKARLEDEPGVELLLGARSGVDYETHNVMFVLVSSKPVPRKLEADLEEIIERLRGENVTVRIIVLEEGEWSGIKPERRRTIRSRFKLPTLGIFKREEEKKEEVVQQTSEEVIQEADKTE